MSSSFRDQSWMSRYQAMGDKAESAFEQIAEHLSMKVERYGFSRPPFSIQTIPLKIRYTPDYVTLDGLIECQGLGRDGVLKIKREKLTALQAWDLEHPVSLFAWHSTRKRWVLVTLAQLNALIDAGNAELGYFPEGKAYWGIHADRIEGWAKADWVVTS